MMKFRPGLYLLVLAASLVSLGGCNSGSSTEAASGGSAGPAPTAATATESTATTAPGPDNNRPETGIAAAEQSRLEQAQMVASILSRRPPPLQPRKEPISIGFREPLVSTD
ncbi:MAG TPA: hypothetical protein PLN94_12300, partial [Thiolinea sp.]|nr:hypothetical protein [Thiolinea sp.]